MMIKMKIKRNNIQKVILLLASVILITIFISPKQVNAYVVLDPVDPYFISEGEIPEGEELDLYYYLEKGQPYHIFMVGDWVEDNTSRTDYDIFTYYPSNLNLRQTTHTEAAALPEQVANDLKHQYYVPEESGAHKFRILNDEENGEGNKGAIFHVIEHINLNTPVKKELKGYNELRVNEKREKSVWAYEFRTRALDFEVFVDVSDHLDMYELRVYPMANIENVGYNLNGVATPSGDLYNQSGMGDFGGFNTEIDGYRDALASAEYSGRDMRLGFRKGENVSDTEPTFYFLVLIAEWGEGSVEFFIKTEYYPPNMTLIDPPVVGYTTEETEIKVEIESKIEIEKVWVNYTIDDWKHEESLKCVLKDGYYEADLPPFELHDNVEYEVYVKDVVDNENEIQGSFSVYRRAVINMGISSSDVKGGQSLKIIGTISKRKSDLVLNITSDRYQNEFQITTDQVGEYAYDFTPPYEGDYSIQVVYEGDDDYYTASSELKFFEVIKQDLEVNCEVDTKLTKGFPITVKGNVYPPETNVVLDLIFITPSESITKNATTDMNGEFSAVIVPLDIGEWQCLPQVRETELLAPAQGDLISFSVQKQSMVDSVYLRAMLLISPPWVYGLAVIIVIIIVVFELRTGTLRKALKRGEAESDEDEYEGPADASSYRRRSNR